MSATIRAWGRIALKEPLAHFLIAGLAVFLFSAWRGDAVDPASRTITITAEQVQRLAEGWQQTWQRPPTRQEIDGLIRDYIKEEVYVREGARLGLDADDPVIRRRLRSKMEFLAAQSVDGEVPSEAELQALLDRNPGKYGGDAVLSFDQVYVAGQDDRARARAGRILADLRRGKPESGDPISLPAHMESAPLSDVARTFGDDFASAMTAQKPGDWAGPMLSGFGLHLVRLRALSVAGKPKLTEIRQRVENDWHAATLTDRQNRAYQVLLDSYTIKIAKP